MRKPVDKRMLLATFVCTRAPGTPAVAEQSGNAEAQHQNAQMHGSNGNGHHLPAHMRSGGPGPAGSPINAGQGTFSPIQQQMHGGGYNMPPNPYAQQQPEAYQQSLSSNPLVNEILGGLQHAPSAMAILAAKPDMGREQLDHLRRILEEDPMTRTNLEALSRKLVAEGEGM